MQQAAESQRCSVHCCWPHCAGEAASRPVMPVNLVRKVQLCVQAGTAQSGGSGREEDDGHDKHRPK